MFWVTIKGIVSVNVKPTFMYKRSIGFTLTNYIHTGIINNTL